MTMKDFGAKNSDLNGIQYLRNVEDADALVAYMKEAKKVSNKAVMVGGGYIGLEVTANLVQNGFEGQCPVCCALFYSNALPCMSCPALHVCCALPCPALHVMPCPSCYALPCMARPVLHVMPSPACYALPYMFCLLCPAALCPMYKVVA